MGQAIRIVPAAALVAVLAGESGCATEPPTAEERAAVWLAEAPRHLTIHVDRQLPAPELHSRDNKVGERVGKGAAYGTGMALAGIGEFCLTAFPLGCVVGVAVSPVMFVGGAVYGAASVDAVDIYHPIESANGAQALFTPTNEPIDLPGLLEETVIARTNGPGRHAVHVDGSDGQNKARADFDGKLELSFRAFEFFGDEGKDPSVALVLSVSADLATAENEAMRVGEFTYQSPAHYVSGWKADDARLFREETGKAVRDIAAQIADKLDSSPSMMARARVSAWRARQTTAAPAAHETPPGVALAAPAEPGSGPSGHGLVAAGTSWTYAFSDRIYGRQKSRITVSVADADDAFVYEKVSAIEASGQARTTSRTISAGEASFDLYRLNGDRTLTEFAPYLLAAGGEDGLKSVAGAKGYPTSGYSGWVTRSAPPVWEQVTVPAGTFRALRFELHGRREIPPFTSIAVQRFEIRVWYAPAVHRYVRLEHRSWLSVRRPYTHDVVELVEYHPPARDLPSGG